MYRQPSRSRGEGTGEPDEPGTPGWELAFDARDDEPVVRKAVPDAFAADPKLAEDLKVGSRYRAARAAALAGRGAGVGGSRLSEEARTRWRE